MEGSRAVLRAERPRRRMGTYDSGSYLSATLLSSGLSDDAIEVPIGSGTYTFQSLFPGQLCPCLVARYPSAYTQTDTRIRQ